MAPKQTTKPASPVVDKQQRPSVKSKPSVKRPSRKTKPSSTTPSESINRSVAAGLVLMVCLLPILTYMVLV